MWGSLAGIPPESTTFTPTYSVWLKLGDGVLGGVDALQNPPRYANWPVQKFWFVLELSIVVNFLFEQIWVWYVLQKSYRFVINNCAIMIDSSRNCNYCYEMCNVNDWLLLNKGFLYLKNVFYIPLVYKIQCSISPASYFISNVLFIILTCCSYPSYHV